MKFSENEEIFWKIANVLQIVLELTILCTFESVQTEIAFHSNFAYDNLWSIKRQSNSNNNNNNQAS